MKRALLTGLILGLALFTGVIAYQGVGDVLAAVAVAGWGLLLVTFAHLAVVLIDAMSWRALLDHGTRRSLHRLAWMWWIGEAVNALLPVAQVGGELVRARLLNRDGVPGAQAGASVVVGLTAGVLTLLMFAAGGAVLMGGVLLAGEDGLPLLRLAVGIAVLGCLLYGFYLAQHRNLFLRLGRLVERLASGRDWLALTGDAAALDRSIVELYRARRKFLACCAWRLVAWLAGVAEVWLALHLLGYPATFAEAFVLESLGQAARSTGFAIPGALGVQEGGFLVVGLQLGIPGEVALGVSLVKRVRDLLLGLPGLASWKLAEASRLITPRRT